jgi:hypothetical protein
LILLHHVEQHHDSLLAIGGEENRFNSYEGAFVNLDALARPKIGLP